jgi:hypothetical protein
VANPSRRLTRPAVVTGLLGPPVAAALYIQAFGVNVAFSDQLRMAPYFEALDEGRLTLEMAFALNNEHRIFFPRLATLLVGQLTRFNNIPEMYLGWMFLVLSGVLIAAIHRRQGATASLASLVPISLLLFHWRQHELFVRGDSLPTYMSLAGLLGSLLLLDGVRAPGGRFAGALAAATFASFSYLNGLLAWPLGACVLLTSRAPVRRPLVVSLWLGVGAAVTLLYFAGYVKPDHHPPLWFVLRAPALAIQYFLAACGSPFAAERIAAVSMGASLLALYAVSGWMAIRVWRAGEPLPLGAWLILFAVLSQAVIAVGRSGFGVDQALSSRYTPFAMLGPIGAYLVWTSRAVAPDSLARRSLVALLALAMVGLPAGVLHGYETGVAEHIRRLRAAYILRTAAYQTDDSLDLVDRLPDQVRRNAAILERLQLNVFAGATRFDDLAPGQFAAAMSLDWVNGQTPVPGKPLALTPAQEVVLEGWAVDLAARRSPGAVFALVDGRLAVPMQTGIARPDVAAHFAEPEYENAGFRGTFAASLLSPGTHTLRFAIQSSELEMVTLAGPEVILSLPDTRPEGQAF